MTDNAIACWVGGLSLIGLTIAIHAIGLTHIALLLRWFRRRIDIAHLQPRSLVWVARLTLAATGAALAFLHAIEAAIWAIAYYWIGALPTMTDAVLYSIDSMTTRGASGLVLGEEWRLMGALEASDGMLLFGISTAFLFAMLQHTWNLLTGGTAGSQGPMAIPMAGPGHRNDRQG
jgi:hypothetical protein